MKRKKKEFQVNKRSQAEVNMENRDENYQRFEETGLMRTDIF